MKEEKMPLMEEAYSLIKSCVALEYISLIKRVSFLLGRTVYRY